LNQYPKNAAVLVSIVWLGAMLCSCVTTARSEPKAHVTPLKKVDLNDPAQRAARKKILAGQGLNEFCDPIATVYMGGNPLFDSSTGVSKSLDDYLREKDFDAGCKRFQAGAN